MNDEETIAQINGKYVMPPDAGPAWRKAAEMGMDMSLIECNLELTPWERLLRNDGALEFINSMRKLNPVTDGDSDRDR